MKTAMKTALKKWFKRRGSRIGYGLAGLVMLFFFLWLRFPGEAVTGYLEAAFAARCPQARLTLSTVRPSLPPGPPGLPGLRTGQAVVRLWERPGVSFRAEDVTLRPLLLPLLRGRAALEASARGYGGTLQGRIAFQRLFSLGGDFTCDAAFQEFQAGQMTWLKEIFISPLTGRLQGTFQYSGQYSGTGESLRSGTGRLGFTVADGTYPLEKPFFGIERVDFSRIEGEVSYRNGVLQLSRLTLTGEKLRLSFKGNLLLAGQWPESRLDLTGTVQLTDQGGKPLRVAVEGTVGNPRARLL